MAKKKNMMKVVIETLSEFLVVGPNDTEGWVKVYKDYEVEAEASNSKNSGGEIWEWAQSHWPEFAEEDQDIEVGGGTIKGQLRWICVRGVKNAANGASLPIQDEYKRPIRASKHSSSSTKKKSGVKAEDKSKKRRSVTKPVTKPAPPEEDEFGGIFDGVDIEDTVNKKIKKALED